jgi:hypothetical protein
MQCVLQGFAQTAQIREFKQCLERVNHLISLLLSVSDFNPVFICKLYCSHGDLPWHMQQFCRRIRVIQTSIAGRTSPGISPRRAWALDAGFSIRVVR